MGDYAFDADTSVTASGPSGSFAAELTGRWDGTNGAVNGGYMLTVCARALGQVVPFQDPIVISGFFLRPGVAGPAGIRTSLARSGRTTAFGEAVLTQGGKEVVRATAAFAALGLAGPVFVEGAPPDLPAPEDCYHEEDFEVWDSAGTLVAQSRQLAMVLPLPPA
jgi:acyl-CoA thioesterase